MVEIVSIEKENQAMEREKGQGVIKAEKTLVIIEKCPKSRSVFICTSCEYKFMDWIRLESLHKF